MRGTKAIFIKQTLDIFKNSMVMIQFVVFPIVAFVMTELVAKADDAIPDNMFITVFAPIFAGMSLLITTASIIAEDRERKSLRFLVMAGVKPYEYMMGIGGVILTAGLLVSVVFGVMGGFEGIVFIKFICVMLLGSVASVLLGATIGIISKNQQAATALGMPVAMILGFNPMITMFNKNAEKIFSIFYTQQVNTLINDSSVNLIKPVLIILANIAVLIVLFTLAYKKKGLKS